MLTNAQQTLPRESTAAEGSRLWRNLLFGRPLTALVIIFGVIDLVALLTVLLSSAFHREVFVVTSGSMAPEVKPGDALLIDPSMAGQPQPGDVIVFAPGQTGTLRAHRVLEVIDVKGVPHVRTKGDANTDSDADLTPLINVRGEATLTLPKIGYLLDFLAHSKAAIAFFVVPLVILALREMFDVTPSNAGRDQVSETAVPS